MAPRQRHHPPPGTHLIITKIRFVAGKGSGYNGHMPKRLILAATLALALCPAVALADDPPATSPTDTPAPAQVQQDPSASAGLGPAASGGTGSSAATGNMLQGAGTNPLQSTTEDSAGLTAPASNALQAPSTPDETLRVIQGEADGSPHSPTDTGPSHWAWAIWALIIAAIALLIFLALRRRSWPKLPELRLPGRRSH